MKEKILKKENFGRSLFRLRIMKDSSNQLEEDRRIRRRISL